jgi:hypothetical protein
LPSYSSTVATDTLTQRWLTPRLPRRLLISVDPAALVKAPAGRIAFGAAAENFQLQPIPYLIVRQQGIKQLS